MKKITVAQFDMLCDAGLSYDGSVIASGFNNAKHSTATGKSLVALGYLVEVPAIFGGHTYKLTDAGRAVKLTEDIISNPHAEARKRLRREYDSTAKWLRHEIRVACGSATTDAELAHRLDYENGAVEHAVAVKRLAEQIRALGGRL